MGKALTDKLSGRNVHPSLLPMRPQAEGGTEFMKQFSLVAGPPLSSPFFFFFHILKLLGLKHQPQTFSFSFIIEHEKSRGMPAEVQCRMKGRRGDSVES
jgi:hypothetical protein